MYPKIWVIHQDHQDNYWFGSNGKGLYQYDGKNLRLFTTNEGLIDNAIRGIQEDHLGNIFIETPAGVSRFDGEKFTSLKPVYSLANEWKLEANDLWFNCNGNPNEVYRYDGENLYELRLPRQDLKKAFGIEEEMERFSPYTVFKLDKDPKGNLWIGTGSAGVFRYDGNSFLWIGEKELSTLEDGRVPGVRSMLQDEKGDFWLSNVLYRYRISSDSTYTKLAGINFSTLTDTMSFPYYNGAVYENGNLWMAKYGEGIWRYDGKKLKSFSLSNGDEETEVLPVSIYQDRRGILWVGTDSDGVYQYDGQVFKKFEP